MSLNFPSSPVPGETYTAQGVTFVWTGTVWVMPPSGLLFATQGEAEAGEVDDRGLSPLTGSQADHEGGHRQLERMLLLGAGHGRSLCDHRCRDQERGAPLKLHFSPLVIQPPMPVGPKTHLAAI